MHPSGSTFEIIETQSSSFRFPGGAGTQRRYHHIAITYAHEGEIARLHHVTELPPTDSTGLPRKAVRAAIVDFAAASVGTRLPADDPDAALLVVEGVMEQLYSFLAARIASAGWSPRTLGASERVAEVAFGFETALLRLAHRALGRPPAGHGGGPRVAECYPAQVRPNPDGGYDVEPPLGPLAWVQQEDDAALTFAGCRDLLRTEQARKLYVLAPAESFGPGVTQDEPTIVRMLDGEQPLPTTLASANTTPLMSPHTRGGLAATLRALAGGAPVEGPVLFPSRLTSELPASVLDLLPAVSETPFLMMYAHADGEVGTAPARDSEAFWRDALDAESFHLSTSGEYFLHDATENINYYEEEKYLEPVGAVGSKARLLQKASLVQGFNTIQYSRGSFALVDANERHLLFHSSATPLNSAAAKAVCNDKETTRIILQRNDVPVPAGRVFKNGDVEAALAYAETIGYPLVVKPAMGTMGIGVRAGIQNEEEFRDALDFASSSRLGNQDIIVEQHIFGDEYRISVVDNAVVAAVQREPASVIGDGRHTVAELVVRKNAFRRTNPQLASSPILYSEDVEQNLHRQGLNLTAVPEKNRHVVLSSSSNISLGGDSREMSDSLHPTVIDAAIRAVQAIPGLNYCGVDFLLPDPTKSIHEQVTGICELNAQAATGTAQYPLYGTRRHVPARTIAATVRKFDLQPVVPAPREQMSLRLTIRGRIMGIGYHEWFAQWARDFGVVGRIYDLNDRIIRVEMTGVVDAIAALSAAALGGPRGSRPTSVISEHIAPVEDADFHYVTQRRNRLRRWLRR